MALILYKYLQIFNLYTYIHIYKHVYIIHKLILVTPFSEHSISGQIISQKQDARSAGVNYQIGKHIFISHKYFGCFIYIRP